MKKLFLSLMLALLASNAWATATPANVSVGAFNNQQSSATLSWDNDATATQWFIYFNGNLRYSPLRTEVTVGGGRVSYNMYTINASSLPATITVVASQPGSPLSAASTGVVLSTAVPIAATYVIVTNTVQTSSAGTSTVTVSGTVNTNTKILQPAAGLQSLTLAATTTWDYVELTCPSQPCNITVFNQGATPMLWWVDDSTDDPAFSGISLSAGANPFILDITPGSVFHYRYSQAGGNGFIQNRW